MIKVYIVEDHSYLLDDILYSLKVQGFECYGAAGAEELNLLMQQGLPDILVLDWTLLGEDGLAIAKRMRNNNHSKHIGIIFLTARSSLNDRLVALEIVDSYQIKPIDYRELGAVINSVYRRLAPRNESDIPELSWRLYEKNRELHAPSGDFVSLSQREYSVISKLTEDDLKPVSVKDVSELWDEEWSDSAKNRIELLFSRLRKKIRMLDESVIAPIKAVRHQGYFLKIPIKVIKDDKLSALANNYSYPTPMSEIARTLGREKHLELGNHVCELTSQGVMITDKDKNIIRVNNAFCAVTGYQVESVLGCNPRLLSSGRHNSEFYKIMWREINKNDEWKGEVFNRRKNGEIYQESINIYVLRNLKNEVENYLAIYSEITREQAYFPQLQDVPERDPLTGLPNKQLLEKNFSDIVAISKKQKTQFSLLFIDLNKFKPINDVYGHIYGDFVLQMIAARIEFSVNELDLVVRLTGDEFIVVMANIEHDNSAEILSNKLKAMIAKELIVEDHVLQVTASIGWATYPEQGSTLEALQNVAGTNMSTDKASHESAARG